MNYDSFLGQEHCFFNVIVSCLITLKDIKNQNILHPKTRKGSTPDPKLKLR